MSEPEWTLDRIRLLDGEERDEMGSNPPTKVTAVKIVHHEQEANKLLASEHWDLLTAFVGSLPGSTTFVLVTRESTSG